MPSFQMAAPPVFAADQREWLIPMRRCARPTVRLVCVPFAGSGPAVYHEWRDELPEGVELWSVQLPGRERRLKDVPYRRLADVVAAMAPLVARLTDVPCALLGHSMGALVAFETARAINARTTRGGIDLLIVSGCLPPTVPRSFAIPYDLPDRPFVTALRALNESRGQVVDDDILHLMLPTIRADFELTQTYAYEGTMPSLRIPIVAIGGVADSYVPFDGLCKWTAHTDARTFVYCAPGNHFFIVDARRDVLPIVTLHLERVRRH